MRHFFLTAALLAWPIGAAAETPGRYQIAPVTGGIARLDTQTGVIVMCRNEDGERAVLVDVYMPSVRLARVNRSVNRTVTLPAWLNAAALERNVNFSQVLQDALRTQLHL